MISRQHLLVTLACSGLLASGCFEDPVSLDTDDEEEETGNGDGDGDGECGPNEELCGGICTNTAIDSMNCGECGNACPALTMCGEGMCKELKFVFATDEKFQGNLGGLDPDQICQDAAMAASLPAGDYRAWISDAGGSPSTSFNTDGVYVVRQGPPVAYSWEDLTNGDLAAPINRTQFGELLLSSPACNNTVTHAVWTATAPDGTLAGPNCDEWASTVDAVMGRVGNADVTDAAWSASDCTPSCATALPIYCVQQ